MTDQQRISAAAGGCHAAQRALVETFTSASDELWSARKATIAEMWARLALAHPEGNHEDIGNLIQVLSRCLPAANDAAPGLLAEIVFLTNVLVDASDDRDGRASDYLNHLVATCTPADVVAARAIAAAYSSEGKGLH